MVTQSPNTKDLLEEIKLGSVFSLLVNVKLKSLGSCLILRVLLNLRFHLCQLSNKKTINYS